MNRTMSYTHRQEYRGVEIEVDCTVEFEVSGRHVPMRWGPDGGSPEEFPDVDVLAVTVDATGEDITSEVDMDRVTDLINDQLGDIERDSAYDAAEAAADARADR